MWPFKQQRETRDSSYTDSLIAQIVSQASGATLAKPAATGALEAAASIIARCFAAADVSGPDRYREALGPSTLSMIGRALVRQGEIVFAIEVKDGRLMLLPAASWDVTGDVDPASWTYRLTLGGPSRFTTLDPVPSNGMIHVRYQADPEQPWRGVAPLASAAIAGRLSAETMQALSRRSLADRVACCCRRRLTVTDPTIARHSKPDLKSLRGKVALVESPHRAGGRRTDRQSKTKRRLGVPAPGCRARRGADRNRPTLHHAKFIPRLRHSAVARNRSRRNRPKRRLFRRLLHSYGYAPLGRIVAEELSSQIRGRRFTVIRVVVQC